MFKHFILLLFIMGLERRKERRKTAKKNCGRMSLYRQLVHCAAELIFYSEKHSAPYWNEFALLCTAGGRGLRLEHYVRATRAPVLPFCA